MNFTSISSISTDYSENMHHQKSSKKINTAKAAMFSFFQLFYTKYSPITLHSRSSNILMKYIKQFLKVMGQNFINTYKNISEI